MIAIWLTGMIACIAAMRRANSHAWSDGTYFDDDFGWLDGTTQAWTDGTNFDDGFGWTD